MPTSEFHKELAKLVAQTKMPNFIIYGYQDEKGKLEVNYAYHKMSLKNVLKGIFMILSKMVEKKM